jgi:hypothetical protein
MDVRTAATSAGQGVFAIKAYEPGDVICDEAAPLVRLAPTDDEAELIAALVPAKSSTAAGKSPKGRPPPSLWQVLDVPGKVPSGYEGIFKGMVQAALCWVIRYDASGNDQNQAIRAKVLQLYHPSLASGLASPSEVTIVAVARQALAYLQKHACADHAALQTALQQQQQQADHKDELLRVMLIWTCNAFAQGRVYETISRLNHSCDPNAVVQTEGDERQRIVAATSIAIGDEISISYLGLMLYSETSVRQAQLSQTKHFDCACTRCTTEADTAAALPCFHCHPRVGRQLEEDTQYDDDQTVHYVVHQPAATFYECATCRSKMSLASDEIAKHLTAGDKVVQKVVKFLKDYDRRNDESQDDEDVQDELLDQHIRMSSTVLGAKHWTTNLLLLLQVDGSLQSLHGAMLTEDGKESPPDLDTMAATVDSVERVLRFVQGLGLALDPGHIVGDVIIGLARALVALGDLQSQKYAATWIDKIADSYVKRFCSPGLQKVVTGLHTAWQRQGGSKPSAAKKIKR